MSLTVGPDRYSAPPVETWTMPSLRPRRSRERGVQGLGGGDVDGREGEAARLRPVEHLGVDLGGGDGHACVLLVNGWASTGWRSVRTLGTVLDYPRVMPYQRSTGRTGGPVAARRPPGDLMRPCQVTVAARLGGGARERGGGRAGRPRRGTRTSSRSRPASLGCAPRSATRRSSTAAALRAAGAHAVMRSGSRRPGGDRPRGGHRGHRHRRPALTLR